MSLLQGLIARPLVVGAASGLVVGDVETGLRVGAVLELFALDVVPVGASRYPDFGAATAAAVLYAAHTEWTASLGAAVGLGLALATAGGATITLVRRWNARTVKRRAGSLHAGDPAAVRGVHLVCLGHDAIRSTALAFASLGVALAARGLGLIPEPALGAWLTTVAFGGGVWAAAHGATVSARSGGRRGWAVGGLVVGLLVALR